MIDERQRRGPLSETVFRIEFRAMFLQQRNKFFAQTFIVSYAVSQVAFCVLRLAAAHRQDRAGAFPSVAVLSRGGTLIKLKVVQVFQKFLVKFGLQFQREAR
ncbi:MAG TPA: hypothetical protein VGQ61_16925, partial [Candidatus Angelobacter sp.]|nr:hypothetical protein [Candidatus Angelobacter sp.]